LFRPRATLSGALREKVAPLLEPRFSAAHRCAWSPALRAARRRELVRMRLGLLQGDDLRAAAAQSAEKAALLGGAHTVDVHGQDRLFASGHGSLAT
jgi:hypothetical protein